MPPQKDFGGKGRNLQSKNSSKATSDSAWPHISHGLFRVSTETVLVTVPRAVQ